MEYPRASRQWKVITIFRLEVVSKKSSSQILEDPQLQERLSNKNTIPTNDSRGLED